MRLQRLPISSRTAPRRFNDAVRSPAAKNIASPAFALAAAIIPVLSFSDRFFDRIQAVHVVVKNGSEYKKRKSSSKPDLKVEVGYHEKIVA